MKLGSASPPADLGISKIALLAAGTDLFQINDEICECRSLKKEMERNSGSICKAYKN